MIGRVGLLLFLYGLSGLVGFLIGKSTHFFALPPVLSAIYGIVMLVLWGAIVFVIVYRTGK